MKYLEGTGEVAWGVGGGGGTPHWPRLVMALSRSIRVDKLYRLVYPLPLKRQGKIIVHFKNNISQIPRNIQIPMADNRIRKKYDRTCW